MQAPVLSAQTRAASRTSTPSLPRLPVPDMHTTLQKYLRSLEPILLEDEARGGTDFRTAYAARVKLVEDFEHGLGPTCQERLQELNKNSPNNWLDDGIWLKKAYHEWQAPLIVNSNWWLALGDDPVIPSSVRFPTSTVDHCTLWQIRRAAWLAHRVLDFKTRLERQELYPDTTRTGTHRLWFRHSALQAFNTCRIPQRECDRFLPRPTASDSDGRKILVMVADWMYAVEAIAPSGDPIPAAAIERRLRAIVSDAESRQKRGECAVPLSVLTTDDRDRWADNLAHLLSLSPANRSIFTTITNSAIAVSLDNYAYDLPKSQRTSDPDLTAHLHNIRSGHNDRPGHNRWYDKAFTLIVEANTRAGVLGEHSPVDALVPSIIADYAIVQGVDEAAFPSALHADDSSVQSGDAAGGYLVSGWERLDWVVDAKIEAECAEAARRAKAIVDDSDNDELVFDAYGVDWIKEARLPPDAYIQMALQLAWYRTRGEFTATYETALTRLFKHGRTETIRTLSTDSRAWVLAMADPSTSNDTRFVLLQRALQTHSQLTREAATGRGIDRHLLGLRLMLRADAGEHHALFEDELFARSQEWKLSTSGLSAGYQFRGTGFGASYEDGYGINYMPAPDLIRFGIESKHSCSKTSTQGFKTAIADVLENMRTLCTPTLQAHL
ncbi:acyltransferase ChoActase/COT/CPT [Trametes versicolor FP-101664 SS1]|uniref:acyltransferase ChoActase/COT/CPT n=1 Tax=Trametes versicolor (strain FP-101664) TaxID=717944 RepID=UPI000462301F|nr:acyltransferase ChoActase/COT/CPT [Trametes versicolor FP-101664 SS1]EIW57547.1 acyltransferase ChoActase/COT/CPT [Trametes versicolor FP-101664 SS1]